MNSQSVQFAADSLGFADLSDSAASVLADEAALRLHVVALQAKRFMLQRRHSNLSSADVESALQLYGNTIPFGSSSRDVPALRHAKAGASDIYFEEDKDLDVDTLLAGEAPKRPVDVNIHSYWLAVAGVQPAIPENPHRAELSNVLAKHALSETEMSMPDMAGVSVEQRLYYKELSESCICLDKDKRAAALDSLSTDQGLEPMLPCLVNFITEGIKINVSEGNFIYLIYLARMLKSLCENPSLLSPLQHYMHHLLPSCVTCLLSKKLCLTPEIDKHWNLRQFIAKRIAYLLINFSTAQNEVRSNTVQLLEEVLSGAEQMPFVIIYGAFISLCEIGDLFPSSIKPHMRRLAQLCSEAASSEAKTDQEGARFMTTAVEQYLPGFIRTEHSDGISQEAFFQLYGSFAPSLWAGLQDRSADTTRVKVPALVRSHVPFRSQPQLRGPSPGPLSPSFAYSQQQLRGPSPGPLSPGFAYSQQQVPRFSSPPPPVSSPHFSYGNQLQHLSHNTLPPAVATESMDNLRHYPPMPSPNNSYASSIPLSRNTGMQNMVPKFLVNSNPNSNGYS